MARLPGVGVGLTAGLLSIALCVVCVTAPMLIVIRLLRWVNYGLLLAWVSSGLERRQRAGFSFTAGPIVGTAMKSRRPPPLLSRRFISTGNGKRLAS